MLKQQSQVFTATQFSLDIAAVALGYMAAVLLRWGLRDYFDLPFEGTIQGHMELLVIILPISAAVFLGTGLYGSSRRASASRVAAEIGWAVLVNVVLLNTVIVILKLEETSRAVIVVFAALSFVGVLTERLGIRWGLQQMRRAGYNYRSILLVGTGEGAQSFSRMLREHDEWGLRLYGCLSGGTARESGIEGAELVGGLDDLAGLLDRDVIDEVVIFSQPEWGDRIEGLIAICEEVGVQATVSMDRFRAHHAEQYVVDLDGFLLLTYSTLPSRNLALVFKRAFDLFVSVGLLVLLAPLLAGICLSIWLRDGRPIWFRQTRVGINGRLFTLYKFRTMVPDAEALRSDLEKLNERDGPTFKITNDPRVTRTGQWLRQTSLDELPQLWNVVRGEMSLVGPRPPLPQEVDQYERWQRRRLSMKPGITGLWQVSDRGELSFQDWVKLDLEYIDRWSFSRDLAILLRTVRIVVRKEGAC